MRFVHLVEDVRQRQILDRFGGSRPMVLYCWVDELAGELRLSLVSASHGRLPFGRPPEIVESLVEIVREYLACAYHDGHFRWASSGCLLRRSSTRTWSPRRVPRACGRARFRGAAGRWDLAPCSSTLMARSTTATRACGRSSPRSTRSSGSTSTGVDLERWTQRFVAAGESAGVCGRTSCTSGSWEENALPHPPEDLREAYVRGFAQHAVPHADLHQILSVLREAEWRTGVVTNGRSAFQRATVAALGIGPLLDAVVVSEEVGLRKPDHRIFGLALRELGCEAAGSWFVGDDPVADVQGAASTGMRTLLFGGEGEGAVARLADVPRLLGLAERASGAKVPTLGSGGSIMRLP